MFSHVVIFWTDPKQANAAEELAAGAEKYLKSIPGILLFHVGHMVKSDRPVVDQSYQVALNVIFGVAAGWAIARFRFPGRTLLTAVIDMPFTVSPVVVGLFLLLLFGG